MQQTSPLGSVVERVTSNDKVVSSILAVGICFYFCMFTPLLFFLFQNPLSHTRIPILFASLHLSCPLLNDLSRTSLSFVSLMGLAGNVSGALELQTSPTQTGINFDQDRRLDCVWQWRSFLACESPLGWNSKPRQNDASGCKDGERAKQSSQAS